MNFGDLTSALNFLTVMSLAGLVGCGQSDWDKLHSYEDTKRVFVSEEGVGYLNYVGELRKEYPELNKIDKRKIVDFLEELNGPYPKHRQYIKLPVYPTDKGNNDLGIIDSMY